MAVQLMKMLVRERITLSWQDGSYRALRGQPASTVGASRHPDELRV